MAVRRTGFIKKHCSAFVLSSNSFHPQTDKAYIKKRLNEGRTKRGSLKIKKTRKLWKSLIRKSFIWWKLECTRYVLFMHTHPVLFIYVRMYYAHMVCIVYSCIVYAHLVCTYVCTVHIQIVYMWYVHMYCSHTNSVHVVCTYVLFTYK
jgi:hypothetical protein